MNNLTPIALFAYNRPWHTEQVLLALKNNILADKSHLIVFVDGPKTDATKEQIENINAVQKIVKKEQWCATVEFHFSEKNMGCKESIKQGITKVINKYGKVIILEDDIVTSKYFLSYINEALNYYENYKSVFSISGHLSIPISKYTTNYNYDVFAFPRVFIWGWATWKDRWDLVNWEFKGIEELISSKSLTESISRGGDDLMNLLKEQYYNDVDNWDVQVNLAAFKYNLLSINPTISYVNNIGLDGSGAHCLNAQNDNNDLTLSVEKVRFSSFLYIDKQIANILYNNYTFTQRPIWQKIINRISRMFGGKNVFVIKKKIYA